MKKIIAIISALLVLLSCSVKVVDINETNSEEPDYNISELRYRALSSVGNNAPLQEQLFDLLDYYRFNQSDETILSHLILVNYKLQNIFDAKFYLDKLLKLNPANKFALDFYNRKSNELEIEKTFYNYESRNFKAYYRNSDFYNKIKNIINFLENKFIFISNDLEFFNNKKKIVILFYELEDFTQLNDRPYWSSAYFDGKLRINLSLMKRNNFDNILIHELIHSIIYFKCGNNVPIWFHEGLAQYYEYNKKVNFIINEGIINNYLKIEIIEKSFNKLRSEEINIAYLESLFLIKYIIEQYGENTILELLNEFKKSRKFENVYKEILLRNTYTFNSEFKNYLQTLIINE